MGYQNTFRHLREGLQYAEKITLGSGVVGKLIPQLDDTELDFGDGTLSWDLKIFGSAAAGYFSWDASADRLKLEDNVVIHFGTGATAGPGAVGDISIGWDGTDLDILQLTTNSSIKLGVSGAGIDVQMYGDTVGADMLWDQSADSLIFGDNAKLALGASSDITVTWNNTKLLVAQATTNSAIDWGVDGAGIDMVFYGDTASATLTWDQSADALVFAGATSVQGLRHSSAGAVAITTTRAMTLADAGGVFTVAQGATYDIDLPSPTTGAGCRYTFMLVSPGSFSPTITVTGAAATFEGNIVNDVTSVIAATGSTLTFVTGVAALGDTIEIISLSTTKYLVRAVCTANGGITIA